MVEYTLSQLENLTRMSLQTEIKRQTKDALLKKEAVRLLVLRGLVAGFVNELVAKGRRPEGELSDDEALAVIRRQVKQRKDSIEQFRSGAREDLALAEEAELAVLEKFLPATLSREEIERVAAVKKSELGITDKAKAGQLVGAVMKELKGRAEGADVKAAVEKLLE